MKRSLALLTLLATCCASLAATERVARADDATRRARTHFVRGEKLFALGRVEAALDEYELAFEAKPLPDFLFNIGQCHRNLGDYESAIFSYRKYLKLAPDARNREAVEKLIARLEDEIAAAEDAERARRLRLGQRTGRRDRDGISPWWYVGGGVAAVAVTVTAVILLSGDDGAALPDSDLGNLDFGQ